MVYEDIMIDTHAHLLMFEDNEEIVDSMPDDGLEAIVTIGTTIQDSIESIEFAKAHPEKRFLVTRIGCGAARYDASQVAPLFERAIYVSNIVLPSDFWRFLM